MRKSNELQIGKAGEYLVCCDLIMKGYVAFISEQGLPYDVVLDDGNRMYRVQVKANLTYKKTPQRATERMVYIFNIKRKGKNYLKKYSLEEIDIFALVGLDSKTVAYLPNAQAVETMNFRVPSMRGSYYDEQGMQLKKQVAELRLQGKTCQEISDTLKMKKATVYRYSGNLNISPKGHVRPVYLDEFPIEKCLCLLK